MTALAPWLVESLAKLVAQRGHAWLLHGTRGPELFDLAMALANSWLCESVQARSRLICGHCEACRMIAARLHPDLQVLLPETLSLSLGWPLDEKTQKELDEKKRKPSRQIKTEAVQNLIDFAQRTSANGKGLVAVIYPADAMNHVSANALLKSLEEPVGDTRFILVATDSSILLPTIRSRCQHFRVTRPQTGSLVPWQDLPKKIARSMLTSELPEALSESPATLSEALMQLCHDWLCVGQGAEPRFFKADELITAAPHIVQDESRQAALFKLTAWYQSLNASIRASEHTLNSGLMVEALLAQAKQAVTLRV